MKHLKFIMEIVSDLKWVYIQAFIVLYLISLLATTPLTYIELAVRVALFTLVVLIVGVGIHYKKLKIRWENR